MIIEINGHCNKLNQNNYYDCDQNMNVIKYSKEIHTY